MKKKRKPLLSRPLHIGIAITLSLGIAVVLLGALCSWLGVSVDIPTPPAPVTLAVTTPVCGTWQTTSPAVVDEGGPQAVAALSATDIWTVGSEDRFFGLVRNEPFIQHWDGVRWQDVPANAPAGTTLYALAAIRADDIWAAGYVDTNGHTLSMLLHWDGQRWQSSSAPDVSGHTSALLGIAAVSTADVWAVGRDDDIAAGHTHPLLIHWDGNRWSRVQLPPSNGWLHAVVALAADDVWTVGGEETQSQLAIGGQPSSARGSASYIVHWDGARWMRVASPNSGYAENELQSVVAVSGQLWALGSSTLALRWNGAAWQQVPSPGGDPHGAAALSANDIWVVGEHRGMNGFGVQGLILHWDGSAWSLVPGPEPQSNQAFNGVAAIPGHGIWAVGWSAAKDGIKSALIAQFLPGSCPP